ncbi:hypothetical protein IMZ29_01015 [Achromobacter sp. GG226]|uniref:hypothetical protein n=1 Tax=Verticiella alkaliphila TaxID=2779529 RepID=UPI001C0C29C9|nr:hypothetical protein [Verticiella sp. GG226]MBU4609184.1 hypothetical protein [Verticiella sp. GG226]
MYKLDTQAAKQADRVGGRITEKGKYVGTFTRAQHVVADTGTIGIDFDFVTDDGTRARFAIYTQKADGTQIYGFKQLMAMMTCMQVRELTNPINQRARVYDFDAGQEVDVVVPQFPDLLGKKVGLLIRMEEYGDNGKWRPGLAGAFQAETELVASEILDRKTVPSQLPKMVQALRDKPKQGGGQSVAAGNRAAQEAGYETEQDIPF